MTVNYNLPNHHDLSKEYFLADMHLHTKYSMDCGTKPATLYKIAKRRNINVAITDHNEIKGAKALSMHKDIVVIPGIEVTTTELKDVLVYFDTMKRLEDYYEKIIKPNKTSLKRLRMNKVDLPMETVLVKAQEYGGTVSLAHPFTIGPKKTYPFFSKPENQHLLKYVDAIEVANGTQGRKENIASYGWAQMLKKPITGGSDSHVYWTIGTTVAASTSHSPTTFLEEVRNGNIHVYGLEHKRYMKLVSNIAIIKNKLLKNKSIR
jgi:predicted metal-dependent phosphoesterase TrpH